MLSQGIGHLTSQIQRTFGCNHRVLRVIVPIVQNTQPTPREWVMVAVNDAVSVPFVCRGHIVSLHRKAAGNEHQRQVTAMYGKTLFDDSQDRLEIVIPLRANEKETRPIG
jgi:hypothetical protein